MQNHWLLLVEDDADDEALTLRALKAFRGWMEVRVARDGQEAISALGLVGRGGLEQAGLPELVLLDLKLPRVGGHEILQMIRSDPRTKNLKVVVLSSSEEPSDLQLATTLGADAYICKPMEYEKYLALVNQTVADILSPAEGASLPEHKYLS